MTVKHLNDYSVIRDGSVVLAIGIPFRQGRSPVSKPRVSGFGDLQWTGRDGVMEKIGSTEFPLEDDVIARFAQSPGLQLIEVAGDPVTEQTLLMQRT